MDRKSDKTVKKQKTGLHELELFVMKNQKILLLVCLLYTSRGGSEKGSGGSCQKGSRGSRQKGGGGDRKKADRAVGKPGDKNSVFLSAVWSQAKS